MIISITPEIALDEFPVFAGGLGILEGDKFYEMAKMNREYTVLTLLYKDGYVEYDENLNPKPQNNIKEHMKVLLIPEEELEFQMGSLGKVIIRPYSLRKGKAKVVFFSAESPERVIKATEGLYIEDSPDDFAIKYCTLAKASYIYITQRVEDVERIDLQESLASLVSLLLPKELLVKTRLIIHTPGPWGHPYIDSHYVRDFLGVNLEGNNMITKLSGDRVSKILTVSKKHYDITLRVFPEYKDKLGYATNAVNLDRWSYPGMEDVKDEESLIKLHQKAKRELIALLKMHKSVKEDSMIIAWTRRITLYKRPYFVERLINEVEDKDLIFVIGGKAHPKDGIGLDHMRRFKELAERRDNVIFLKNYDIVRAKLVLSGSDLLLFTPFSGWEASGTSFMKAGINGIPTVASRDGSTIEMIRHGENGWLFGRDLREFINIFTETEKVSKIDEDDFKEFKDVFLNAVKLYFNERDKYREIMFNAFKSFREMANIKRLIHDLYDKV